MVLTEEMIKELPIITEEELKEIRCTTEELINNELDEFNKSADEIDALYD